jgi:peroxiredoxin (alkyl hydroperoxide reductase subunit C)
MLHDETMSGGRIPLIGEKFPEMEVNTTHGPMSLPDAYEGRWFVLFSHPGDFTPVCTTEFVGFSKRIEQFNDLNCGLIGLSIDQVFSHIKWVEWIEEKMETEIPFPIIADDMGRVANQLGMIHPGKGANTVRAVFIIDKHGVVRIILYYPQEIGRNLDEVVRSVKALQTSDEKNVALPANWPENDFLKDRAIVPPPKDMKAAKERPEQYDCYDWWFCHKSLDDK